MGRKPPKVNLLMFFYAYHGKILLFLKAKNGGRLRATDDISLLLYLTKRI